MKKFKGIVITIIIVAFIIFIVQIAFQIHVANKMFNNCKYNGIIMDIRQLEGNRGVHDILINNEWHSGCIYESKIWSYIRINDSIAKDSGTETIRVFRKNEYDEWVVRVFK